MMWAACCLVFLDFYAAASLQCHHKVPTTAKSTFHLRTYVAVDNQANPQPLRVVIKQTKIDPFRQGASLYLGKTNTFICPVTGIFPFLAVRGNQDGPLFILKDGQDSSSVPS